MTFKRHMNIFYKKYVYQLFTENDTLVLMHNAEEAFLWQNVQTMGCGNLFASYLIMEKSFEVLMS